MSYKPPAHAICPKCKEGVLASKRPMQYPADMFGPAGETVGSVRRHKKCNKCGYKCKTVEMDERWAAAALVIIAAKATIVNAAEELDSWFKKQGPRWMDVDKKKVEADDEEDK